MKKALFITYYFPPSGGSKTRRTLKFLKYLGLYDWTPVVLTAKGGRCTSYDPRSLDLVPADAIVYKVPTPTAWLQRFVQGTDGAGAATDAAQSMSSRSQAPTSFLKRYVKRLKAYVGIPDAFIVWAPIAIYQGLKLLNAEAAQVIYTNGPPFSNLLIAAVLKKITGKPLIIDFRDAWVAEPTRTERYPKARQYIERFLERMAIRQADLVLATTEGVTQDFQQRYPTEPPDKFTTLPNGFDREEFVAMRRNLSHQPSEKFRIVHTGHLRSERSPRAFLEALRRLFDIAPEMESDVEVYLVGENRVFNDGKTIDDYLQMYRLQEIVHLTGHVSSAEAIRHQLEADLLLLIIGVVPEEQASTYGIASKVFDYMLAEKPILTLAGQGQVSQLIEETGTGEVLDPADIDAIQAYLWQVYERYQKGESWINLGSTKINQYDCRELTKRLTTHFDQCKL